MIFYVTPPDQPLRVALQRVGYFEHRDRRSTDVSYVRRLGSHLYPRFHLYVQEEGKRIRLNLHLDQKQPSYQGSNKHSGEYDGSTVETEVERIQGFF